MAGLPYHAARNRVVKMALDQGFGWVFFLDTDTVPPPRVVAHLLQTGRDLVGALYFRRYPPYDAAASILSKDAKGNTVQSRLPPYQPGEILPVDFLPTGCTLISRRCIEAMFAHFPRPYDWGFDIAPVPDGMGGALPGFSEDYIFSWRAKTIGFQPYLHTGLVCQHEMIGVVTDQGLVARNSDLKAVESQT